MRLAVILAVIFEMCPRPVSFGFAAEPVFPGKTWSVRPADAVGLDEAKLRAFSQLVGGRGCMVRHGHMVHRWGDASKRGDLASAAKPLYSHFLFKALEAGRIKGLDQPVVELEPRLADLNADLDRKDRRITWRHLANQTSCYGVTEAPGEAFDYSDWQMALFVDLLFTKAWGATYENVDETVLRPLLTDALGCEDEPTLMAFGTGNRPGRVGMSPRDFARFGLLYLHKGKWAEKQLIDEKHAVMAVSTPLPLTLPRTKGDKARMIDKQRSLGGGNNQTDHHGGYSWLWWLNAEARDGKRWWPDAPADMFCALGHCGQRGLAVIPSLDIVVSWNDAKEIHCDRELGNRAFRLIVEAVRDVSAGEPNASHVDLAPSPRADQRDEAARR